ncbi:hypothetical protein [Algicella marina]|uniref:Uncharacterized protein n=1 Tax=Algicella marina TaxID=2683284 RepID=A0A6P1T492_9RHOB|nr:hypothetical protein [Algicella marina]QHQ36513.1 hypothetical protein GO499_15700 [Algicella marina]
MPDTTTLRLAIAALVLLPLTLFRRVMPATNTGKPARTGEPVDARIVSLVRTLQEAEDGARKAKSAKPDYDDLEAMVNGARNA